MKYFFREIQFVVNFTSSRDDWSSLKSIFNEDEEE